MNYIDLEWMEYIDLRDNVELKRKQVSSLYYTGLCEGTSGVEYSFVPLKIMKTLQDRIYSNYDKMAVTDNTVELCNEIYFTTKIEGAKTTYKRTIEIHDGKTIDASNFSENMVKNGFDATKFLNIHGNKLNEDILIQVWNIVVNNACENEDIRGTKYRIGNVQVGTHVGIMPQFLEEYMSYWIDFYNSSEMDNVPFIKAALLHYVFESIHPFCDGNGRTGRLLMINYLISRGYDKLKAVSFSKEIARTINGYYNAFQLSDNSYSDCTPFILYMLRVFDRSIISSIDSTISRKKEFGYNDMLEMARSTS